MTEILKKKWLVDFQFTKLVPFGNKGEFSTPADLDVFAARRLFVAWTKDQKLQDVEIVSFEAAPPEVASEAPKQEAAEAAKDTV